SLVDYWLKVRDEDCFLTARKIIRLEGLLVGGSSGANMFAALKYLHLLKPGQNCVVIFPDGIRNYLSKFASDEWMLNNGFSSENRALNEPIVNYVKFLKPVPTIDVWENIREFIECDSPIALVLLGTKPFGILRKRTILRKMLVAENIHELAVFHCDKNFNLVEKSTTLRDIISIPDLSSLIIRITSDFKEESSEMTERFYTIDEQSILKILRNAKSQ
ncbi:MAG: hypothetical protein NZO16_03950, partial [Deltaproteobacteria bacterium]|nr:hypothetical protein [Deltaproteobacteria bacterium]